MRSLILLLSSLCFVGCAASQKDAEKINFTEVKENLRFDNTDIKRQVFDMNRDGKVDMWKFYTIQQGLEQDAPPEYVLIRKELDLNFDGRVDRIMYYDAKETLALEEIDTDFDGRIDRVSFYDNGLIIKTEIYSAQCRQIVIDAPSNEQVFPISTRHYRKGIFTREETDTKCRGKLETVTIFNDKGEVSQVGYDHTGDGIIDEWIRY